MKYSPSWEFRKSLLRAQRREAARNLALALEWRDLALNCAATDSAALPVRAGKRIR